METWPHWQATEAVGSLSDPVFRALLVRPPLPRPLGCGSHTGRRHAEPDGVGSRRYVPPLRTSSRLPRPFSGAPPPPPILPGGVVGGGACPRAGAGHGSGEMNKLSSDLATKVAEQVALRVESILDAKTAAQEGVRRTAAPRRCGGAEHELCPLPPFLFRSIGVPSRSSVCTRPAISALAEEEFEQLPRGRLIYIHTLFTVLPPPLAPWSFMVLGSARRARPKHVQPACPHIAPPRRR